METLRNRKFILAEMQNVRRLSAGPVATTGPGPCKEVRNSNLNFGQCQSNHLFSAKTLLKKLFGMERKGSPQSDDQRTYRNAQSPDFVT